MAEQRTTYVLLAVTHSSRVPVAEVGDQLQQAIDLHGEDVVVSCVGSYELPGRPVPEGGDILRALFIETSRQQGREPWMASRKLKEPTQRG